MQQTDELVRDLGADAETDARIAQLLRGAIDLHCHSGPSVMPRDLNHVEAIREAEAAGLRAVLLKDHYYSVTPVAALLQQIMETKVTVLTGVPLNNPVGGLNPHAVDHGLCLGARIVWMPTISAANHIRHGHRRKYLMTSMEMLPPTSITIVDKKGRLKDEVLEILDLIAAKDAVLSSGHLHISEIWPLFAEAKRRGVKRLLVNHPTFVIEASRADIRELAGMGAYIEHSVCMWVEAFTKMFSPQELHELIQAGGIDRTILGSDLGQTNNPHPVEGFRQVIRICIGLNYSDDEIRRLIGGNAAALMGLDQPAESGAH